MSILLRREITKTRSIAVRVYRGRIDDYVFGSKHDMKPLSYDVAGSLLRSPLAVACRWRSPAHARLCQLALGAPPFEKTIFNRFLCTNPAGGARKKPNAYALGFFQRCVPQAERDVSFGSEVRFAREVCLRHVIRNTLLHCEWSEQHHYAKHNITWRSQTLLNSKRRRTKRLYFREVA